MNEIPGKGQKDSHAKNQTYLNKAASHEVTHNSGELSDQDKSGMISLHQQMLSRMVKVGYEGLTNEERAYWNSVY